jgi:hypothetical protein
VSVVVCEIALSKGRWNYYPSRRRVRRKLWRLFGHRLAAVTFHDPGADTAVEAEISVEGTDEEGTVDTLIRAFLEWTPEFESMVEVSVAVDWTPLF